MPQGKRGRPAAQNPKNIRLDIRVTEGELRILDDYCKRKGVKRPQGLRDGIKALEKMVGKRRALAKLLRRFPHTQPPQERTAQIV